jgi:hypothetical protein
MAELLLAGLLGLFMVEAGVRTLRWMEASQARARVRVRSRR